MSAKTSKQKQTFSIKAPDAQSVVLAGDFTHWARSPLPLRRQADGVWSVSATLSPGTHHYRFIIDGEWRDDPDCELSVRNPYGTQNAVIQVPRTEPAREPAGNFAGSRRG
jgi:1,4-alpha-glucan branching enzyme